MLGRRVVASIRGMRTLTATLGAIVSLLACCSSAFAGWSVPRSFGVSRYASSAVAVDARGDAAVVWATHGNPGFGPTFRTSVHVTVRTASGRLSTRTVWSSGDAETEDLSVVLGAGEVTVAWDTRSRAEATKGTTSVIRAAYGPLIGRWRPARAIGRVPFEFVTEVVYAEQQQRLAIAADGEVLLAFHASEGAWLAWRTPGHAFGVPQLMRGAPKEAIPQFDAHGTAYLSGSCSGLVKIAPAHSYRFDHTVVLTNNEVYGFTLALEGSGRGLAAWMSGECDGHMPGPVSASVLRGGKFGKPLALTPAATQADGANAVAAPGGGTVTWRAAQVGGPPVLWAFSVQIGANGVPSVTQPIPLTAPIPLGADGGGDVVFGSITPGSGSNSTPFVRPTRGGADQRAPSAGLFAVAAPVGRAVAVVWNASPTGAGPIMQLSVWRP